LIDNAGGHGDDQQISLIRLESRLNSRSEKQGLVRPIGTYLYGRKIYETMAICCSASYSLAAV